MKTITFEGKEYEVENWIKWIAMDCDGMIWGYTNKPRTNLKSGGLGQWDGRTGKCMKIKGSDNPNWQRSLKELDK